jgi:Ca-activated chloride channel family protein
MPEQSDAEEQAAAEDARKALAAEARQQASPGDESKESASQGGVESMQRPLTESEQATEQLLRRIPDDPAGLLRRKLEQSHRSEYPEVRDADEPW